MIGRRALHAPVTAVALSLSACAAASQSGAGPRMPEDTPSEFVTTDGERAVQQCRVTMVDPRDQTRLRLARSAQMGSLYAGDYEVPAGRYGVNEGELLRINCETGQVIGIVPVT